MKEVVSKSEKDTLKAAQDFAKSLKGKLPLILLDGPVGAGKTTWVKGFVKAYLGEDDLVSSPSYSLVNTYTVDKKSVVHVDLYRISGPDDLESIGFWDLLKEKNILIVEWGNPFDLEMERKNVVKIQFTIEGESQRRLTCFS